MQMDSLSSNPSMRRATLIALFLLAVATFITGCSRPTIVEKIKQEHVLHVITRNAPTTYFEDRDGPTGFEYELAKLFAQDLGVDLRLRVASNLGEVYQVLNDNYTNFAATGLSLPSDRGQQFFTSPSYMEITQKLVYRIGDRRPRNTQDLVGKRILVMANSSQSEILGKLKAEMPELKWQESDDREVVDLLKMVEDGEIDFTIIDSNELSVNQAYFPKASPAFDLTEPQAISWVFPNTEDDSLRKRADAFFQRIQTDGTLLQLKERFYGHVDQLNYVGARTFIHHIDNRLPAFEPTFKQVANEYNLDWRLLAAIGYQESHWRTQATSPTGVRGLMMLTQATAQEMGIDNRLSADQSISGGARYFAMIRDRIPERIPEPDRTWMALASYNVGYGHLEDARILTEKSGMNPDKWMDVKEHLPLLQKEKWYTQTKHGYARGWEPVKYVQNIRRYYDVLVWMKQPELGVEQQVAQKKDEENLGVTQTSEILALPEVLRATPPML